MVVDIAPILRSDTPYHRLAGIATGNGNNYQDRHISLPAFAGFFFVYSGAIRNVSKQYFFGADGFGPACSLFASSPLCNRHKRSNNVLQPLEGIRIPPDQKQIPRADTALIIWGCVFDLFPLTKPHLPPPPPPIPWTNPSKRGILFQSALCEEETICSHWRIICFNLQFP